MIGTAHKDMIAATSFGAPLEIKLAADQTAGEIAGYGAIFDALDLQGDIIKPGAFTASLREHKAANTWPAMLWSHDQSKPIGTWLQMGEDGKGLLVAGRINLDVQAGREARALLKAGAIKGLSIGYRADPKATRYDAKLGARILGGVMLHEVSLVSIPANPAASVLQAKSIANPRDLEHLLREAGFSKSAAKALIAGGWRALAKAPDAATLSQTLLAAVKAAALDLKKG
jgi:hypothetical protein